MHIKTLHALKVLMMRTRCHHPVLAGVTHHHWHHAWHAVGALAILGSGHPVLFVPAPFVDLSHAESSLLRYSLALGVAPCRIFEEFVLKGQLLDVVLLRPRLWLVLLAVVVGRLLVLPVLFVLFRCKLFAHLFLPLLVGVREERLRYSEEQFGHVILVWADGRSWRHLVIGHLAEGVSHGHRWRLVPSLGILRLEFFLFVGRCILEIIWGHFFFVNFCRVFVSALLNVLLQCEGWRHHVLALGRLDGVVAE